MTRRFTHSCTRTGVALAGLSLLAGCATARPPAVSTTAATAGRAVTGIMPIQAAAGPSPSAMMICAAETRADLNKALGLHTVAAGTATWVNPVYTCRYVLPAGPLVISVTETADAAATGRTFSALRGSAGPTHDVVGLGQAAYGTDDGTVVLRKDNNILRVDATSLPVQFGAQQQKRTDFAYEIASDILGCWTGD